MTNERQILAGMLQEEPTEDQATDIAQQSADASAGVDVDFDEENSSVTEMEDGSAIIELDDKKDVAAAEEFYANLAEDMDESTLNTIGTKLVDLVEKDIEDRKKRVEQYEEGLRRTGLANDAPGGANFEGASKVTHPLLLEVSIDFAARAIKELWPAGGPAKDKIIGEPNEKKENKAKRKTRYLNWQLTELMPSTRRELEQILSQVPLGGAQYSKLWQDQRKKRPVHEPTWIDDVILPGAATDYYTSERKTHRQQLTKFVFDGRVRSGMYRDIDASKIVTIPDQTAAQQANDKIEGKEQSPYNEDGLRDVYEIDIQYVIEDKHRGVTDPDGDDAYKKGPAPYLITVDKNTRKVLSIYRNWDQEDKYEEALVHMIEWPFIPWRGAMPIGTPQILGGIAAASTGSLRALLDSAHINNFPGGMNLKAGPQTGQTVRIESTQVNEIQGSINQDDIRKQFMPVPVNPPSPVLFQLLGFLIDAGKEVVKTTLDEANDNANVPVGTTMARIEQGMVVFSAIHARLHDSMGRFLKVLHRLNATWLEDELVVEQTGEKMTFKADFDSPIDVVPVSDPEIFSELQRIAQVQTVAERAQLRPDLYDGRAVEEAILERMKIKDAKKFLMPKPEPKPMNAVNENIAASLGQPIVAFPAQDHLAHIETHLTFLMNPVLGQNPLMAPQAIPAILQNVKEHMLFWYGARIHEQATQAAGQDISEFMSIRDTLVQTKFDKMLAAAAGLVNKEAATGFGQVMPAIQQLQQVLKQYQMPQPMDPALAAGAETQRKSKADDQKAQAEAAKNQTAQAALQQKQAKDAGDQQIKMAQVQQAAKKAELDAQVNLQNRNSENETQLQQTDMQNSAHLQGIESQNQTKLITNADDNRTAEEIAAAEIEAGKHTNIKNGNAINKKN